MAICDITILAITIASLLVKMRTKTLPRIGLSTNPKRYTKK